MSWKQPISVAVLVVLTALPVSGTLCALVCDAPAKTSSAHHGSDKNCEQPARPSNGVQIEGVAEHDCSNHDAAVRQVATPAAQRIDLQIAPARFASPASSATFRSLPASASAFDYTSPPGTAPPTTPLVLRV